MFIAGCDDYNSDIKIWKKERLAENAKIMRERQIAALEEEQQVKNNARMAYKNNIPSTANPETDVYYKRIWLDTYIKENQNK